MLESGKVHQGKNQLVRRSEGFAGGRVKRRGKGGLREKKKG